jgi:SAM-dependent methyltransferase
VANVNLAEKRILVTDGAGPTGTRAGTGDPPGDRSEMPRLTPHKLAVQAHFDRLASEMDRWRRKSWYYHRELQHFCRFVIPPGSSVLEIGCGTGDLLASVEPRDGLGVDLSPAMVKLAQQKFPHLTWVVGDAEALDLDRRFEYVILSDLLGHLEDIWSALQGLKRVSGPDTRVVITYYNYLWEPLLRLAERMGQRTRRAMRTAHRRPARTPRGAGVASAACSTSPGRLRRAAAGFFGLPRSASTRFFARSVLGSKRGSPYSASGVMALRLATANKEDPQGRVFRRARYERSPSAIRLKRLLTGAGGI